MKNDKKLQVGSKFVEHGRVYNVFKIERKKIEEKIERIIFYRPYFKNFKNNTLICSIPEKNIKEYTHIRAPISKKDLTELLKNFPKKTKDEKNVDIVEAKTILTSNDIEKTAEVFKRFWREKQRSGVDFTKAKKDILAKAVDSMIEEAALVLETSLEKAQEKIESSIKN